MKMINGNRRRLLCDPGETVSIEVTSDGTAHSLAMSLNGHTFTGGSFTVDTRTDLIVLGIFSNDGGGRYDIRLSGSAGGDQVADDIIQGEGELARKEGTRGYIFTLGQ